MGCFRYSRGSKCLGGGDKGIFVNNEVPYIKIFLELNNKYVIFQFFLKFYNYFSNLQLYVYNFQLSAIGGSSQEPSKPLATDMNIQGL